MAKNPDQLLLSSRFKWILQNLDVISTRSVWFRLIWTGDNSVFDDKGTQLFTEDSHCFKWKLGCNLLNFQGLEQCRFLCVDWDGAMSYSNSRAIYKFRVSGDSLWTLFCPGDFIEWRREPITLLWWHQVLPCEIRLKEIFYRNNLLYRHSSALFLRR